MNTPSNSTANTAFSCALDVIAAVEPNVAEAIRTELHDQRSTLKLIASENYASPAVLLAMGNWMSDKYAEGSPGHRFYAGCDNVDRIESLAVDKVKRLFGADHAYVQPHSGIDANLVAFWAALTRKVEEPRLAELGAKDIGSLDAAQWEQLRQAYGNQKMMGMALDAGGHLTHGFRPNISGKLFGYASYTVDEETHLIDYDLVRRRAHEERPALLIAGYSSYSRRINFRIFREIAEEIDAVFMVDMAHFAGLVAGKVFTGDFDPVAHAHLITSTTHKTLRGPRGGVVLCNSDFASIIDRGCPLVLGGPLPHVMAAKAVAFEEALQPTFASYAHRVVDNAATLAEAITKQGGKIISGGTDNHLMVLDVRPFGITGRQAEGAMRAAGITLNRNVVPFDTNGAWYTSGLRLGTPALTTLGMGNEEMVEIADMVMDVLSNTKVMHGAKGPSKAKFELDSAAQDRTQKRVSDLLAKHPLYEGILPAQ